MPKNKSPSPLLGQVLKKIAPRIGAKVIMEPEWGIVGQIIFRNGRNRYFRYSSLDLNPLGSSEIAKDKDFAAFFMSGAGYPIPQGEKFYSKDWCRAIGSRRNILAAYRYAKRIGFPVFVKPNSGSQGSGAALARNRREFFRAMNEIFRRDRVALVQIPLIGRDYRIVVLDNQVISAYERIPLSIIGDGKSTISRLLKKKQLDFVASSRDTRLKFDDPRIHAKLADQGKSMRSVPKKSELVFLLDNANLSSGGDAVDVTRKMHSGFKKIAIALTKYMGLRFCGVDLMIEGSIESKPANYWVLEINSAPGLDHYAKNGRAQERIVEKLFLKVLKSLEK